MKLTTTRRPSRVPKLLLLVLLCAQIAVAQWSTSGSNVYTTTSGNSVGLGTSSPGAKLHVSSGDVLVDNAWSMQFKDSTGAARRVALWSSSDNIYFGDVDNTGDNSLLFLAGGSGTINFYGNSTTRGIFDAAGNFGIATNSPGARLHVSGGAALLDNNQSLSFKDSGGTARRVSLWSSSNNIYYGDVDNSGNNNLLFLAGGTGTISFYRNGSPAAFIDNSGNVGIGSTSPTSKLYVDGSVTVTGNIGAKYQDVAEWVPASEPIAPGYVVVIDERQANTVTKSSMAYDTRVAGVISHRPGVILGEAGDNKVQVATTGRVKVRVDAAAGPVRIGDLLVTSGKAGTAMRSEPIPVGGMQLHRPGTLIGKALEPLSEGEGEILVLLSLQ